MKKNPLSRASSVEQGGLLRIVRKDLDLICFSGRDDHPCYAFMRFESATAINILALVITLFCFARDVAAAFSMSSGLTKWAMHHYRINL